MWPIGLLTTIKKDAKIEGEELVGVGRKIIWKDHSQGKLGRNKNHQGGGEGMWL